MRQAESGDIADGRLQPSWHMSLAQYGRGGRERVFELEKCGSRVNTVPKRLLIMCDPTLSRFWLTYFGAIER